MLAWILSLFVNTFYQGVPASWFMAFGCVTTPAIVIWLRDDARHAYVAAVARHFVGFDGVPPHVVSIAADCPRRWLVVIHIQLHPELLGENGH